MVANMVPDFHSDEKVTILDFDVVEARNLQGTQFFTPEVKNHNKTEALQYLIYKVYGIEINFINEKLSPDNIDLLSDYNLIVDTFDNYISRKLVQDYCMDHHLTILHCGFSDKFTFSIEFGDHYRVPEDNPKAKDLCELPGASSFVHMVAAIGSSVVQEYLKTGKQREFTGNKFSIREIK